MAVHATTLSMPAGSFVEIEVPVDPFAGQGYFATRETTVMVNGKSRIHTDGFVSENELVGEIEPVSGDALKIKYSHLQNKENRIFFFTATEDVFLISIVAIQIHDHSSIYQGGPAYGTYAYDKTSEEES